MHRFAVRFLLSHLRISPFYEIQGNLQKATVLYQRTLTIRELVYGLYHPKTIETHERLSTVLHQMSGNQKEE